MNYAKNPTFFSIILSFLFCILIGTPALAYISMAESGELLPSKEYQIGIEPQILTNRNSGFNLNLFLDSAVNESTSFRLELGGGSIDFNAFATAKWIPIPDVDKQPAMGLRLGAGIARDDGDNFLQFQFAPLVSKRFDTEYGLAFPYFAVPFTFINTKNDTYVATNISIGSEFKYNEWKNVNMGGEIGLDLNKSWSYLSVFFKFPFDRSKGFGK